MNRNETDNKTPSTPTTPARSNSLAGLTLLPAMLALLPVATVGRVLLIASDFLVSLLRAPEDIADVWEATECWLTATERALLDAVVVACLGCTPAGVVDTRAVPWDVTFLGHVLFGVLDVHKQLTGKVMRTEPEKTYDARRRAAVRAIVATFEESERVAVLDALVTWLRVVQSMADALRASDAAPVKEAAKTALHHTTDALLMQCPAHAVEVLDALIGAWFGTGVWHVVDVEGTESDCDETVDNARLALADIDHVRPLLVTVEGGVQ